MSGPKKRYTLDLGENQNMNKGALVRLICSETGIESRQIGRIEMHSRFSYFEVDEAVSREVLPKLEKGTYEGKSFNVVVSKDQDGGGSYNVTLIEPSGQFTHKNCGKNKGPKKDYKKDYKKGQRKKY